MISVSNRQLSVYVLSRSTSSLHVLLFFFNETATTEIYTLSLHDALPICKKKLQYFGFTNSELLKTGFLSSASNQSKKFENVNFDLFAFNKIINEAWFYNNFDAMENYPKDLNEDKIESLIINVNHSNVTKEWKKWVQEFKKKYLAFSCKIN